jgi:ADP-heptose:LPS heptosyltransferase
MGYGGALIWSGLAKNIKLQTPGKKIVFVYRKRIRDYLFNRKYGDNVIYENNDDIFLVTDSLSWLVKKFFLKDKNILAININKAPYCEKVMSDRLVYRSGAHVIELACRDRGVKAAAIETKLVLRREEIAAADKALAAAGLSGKKFICVEPNSKKNFTSNREWPWDNWQELINKIFCFIKDNQIDISIAQIGAPGGALLDGVIDLRGKTSFREVKRILEKSLFFITTEGGLAHLSASIPKKSLVLISARSPKELFDYPNNISFYTETECKNCGLISPCPNGLKCMKLITVDEVFAAAKEELLKLKTA